MNLSEQIACNILENFTLKRYNYKLGHSIFNDSTKILNFMSKLNLLKTEIHIEITNK